MSIASSPLCARSPADRDRVDDRRPKVIAFYLPQFHPVPENDAWWGPGFTEWRQVVRARPRFPGHAQPTLPTELGFYDLRVPETRADQADLARDHGIDAFCYYHYWFDGRRVLHAPLDGVLSSGEPDFPFALCWANESWTRAWDGRTGEVLLEQSYSPADDLAHIRWLAPVLSDPRYLRTDGRAVLLVYHATKLPDPQRTADTWRTEAARLGVGELYLCRVESFPEETGDPSTIGFDAAVEFQPAWRRLGQPMRRERYWYWLRRAGLSASAYGEDRIYSYPDVVAMMEATADVTYVRHPGVTPAWDNSPRRTQDYAIIFQGSTPDAYRGWLESALARGLRQREPLVFVNAWNEWGEGAVLEPSDRWGRRYLEATRDAVRAVQNSSP